MVCLMFVESKAVVYPNLRVGGLRKLALYLDFPSWKAEREFNSEVQHPPNQATCRSSSNTICGCLKSKH
ncbi:hypothetical protein B9P84_11990, partial [Citrobacter braakii]